MVARDNLAALSPVTRDYSHFMADLTSSVDTGVSVCTRAPQEKLSAGFHPFSPRTHPSRVSPSREIPRRAYTDKSSAGSFDGENSSWRDYKGNREACRRGTATGAVLRTSSRFKDFLNGPPPGDSGLLFSAPFFLLAVDIVRGVVPHEATLCQRESTPPFHLAWKLLVNLRK